MDLPVTKSFAVRIASTFQRHNGYLSDGGNDKDMKGARITGVFTPNSRLSITVIGGYSRNDGIGDQVVNHPPYQVSDPWYYPFPARQLGLFSVDSDYTASAQLNYHINSHLKLTYLTGYDRFDRSQFLILNGIPTPQLNLLETQNIQQYGKFYSHEVRLTGDYNRFRWVAGAYLYKSIQDYNNHVAVEPAFVDVYQGPIQVNGRGDAGYGQVKASQRVLV